MAIVFVAGPLSGLIVQPLVGTASSLVARLPSYSNRATQECSLTTQSRDLEGAGHS
jgi:hypothetical protein